MRTHKLHAGGVSLTRCKDDRSVCRMGSVQLIHRAWPALLEQARERAVGEDHAAGLAARAVIGLVLRIDDALHRGAAHRAGLTVASVHRHLRTEGGDVLWKAIACLFA